MSPEQHRTMSSLDRMKAIIIAGESLVTRAQGTSRARPRRVNETECTLRNQRRKARGQSDAGDAERCRNPVLLGASARAGNCQLQGKRGHKNPGRRAAEWGGRLRFPDQQPKVSVYRPGTLVGYPAPVLPAADSRMVGPLEALFSAAPIAPISAPRTALFRATVHSGLTVTVYSE